MIAREPTEAQLATLDRVGGTDVFKGQDPGARVIGWAVDPYPGPVVEASDGHTRLVNPAGRQLTVHQDEHSGDWTTKHTKAASG